MSATAVAGAEGFSVFPSSDDEESSNIADLSAMFPTLDHDIILTVLQSHHGRLDAAVDYLMAASSVGGDGHTPSQSGIETMYPAHDMEGRYSEDIGGLPEVVPTFEYDNEDDETETDEESTSSLDSSPEPDNNVLDEDDPLPTYEEACMGTDALPMATYILDDQPSEEAVVQTRSEASGGGSEELQKAEHSSDEVKSKESAHKHQKKKGVDIFWD